MIDIEILKEQNKLTLNENDLIYVKPLSQIDWQTYPLEDLSECLLLTLEEYLGLKANYYKFNENLTGLEIVEPEPEPEISLEELIRQHQEKETSEEVIEQEPPIDEE